MVILDICKFLHCLIKIFLFPKFIQIYTFILQRIKYLSIGALSYGYPALLILWITWTDSQNSTNALDVYWEPWSLWRISSPLICGWESKAFCSVRIARSLVILRSVMLATTLRSYRSMIVQLYLTSWSARNRYVKSVHHFWLTAAAVKSCFNLFSNTLCSLPCS